MLNVENYKISKDNLNNVYSLIREMIECGYDWYCLQQSLLPYIRESEYKEFILECRNNLPKDYYKEYPPESFSDIKKYIKDSLLNANIEDLEKYFTSYWNNQDIIQKIKDMRETQDKNLYKEIIDELEQPLDGIIIDNYALSYVQEIDIEYTEKEILETKLFGIWTPAHIQKQKQMLHGDKNVEKLIKKATKIKEGNNV